MKVLLKVFVAFLLVFGMIGCTDHSSSQTADGKVMLGNIADADVYIYQIDSNGLKTLFWKERSSNGKELSDIGKFALHAEELDANTLYLYKVVGGNDWDYNDDGLKDVNATSNQGTFHSIVKGKDVGVLGDNFTVTYLSELLYQAVRGSIGSDDFDTVYEKEGRKLLAQSEVTGQSAQSVAKKINGFVPARANVELNATIADNREGIISDIVSGNKNAISQAAFKSAALVENRDVAVGAILPLSLGIDVYRAYGDIPAIFNLVNSADGSKVALDGYTLPELSSDVQTYLTETVIPKDIAAGNYHVEVILADGDDKNSTNVTASFNVVEQGVVDIGGLAFDADANETSVSSGTVLATKKSIEMSYNDGNITINSTLKIQNRFVDKNITNILLSGFLDISGNQLYVPFESIEFNAIDDELVNGVSYSDAITIPVIEPDTILNISTNIMISRDNLIILMKKLGSSLLFNPQAVLDSFIVLELKTSDGDALDSYRYPVTFFMSDTMLELLSDNIGKLVAGEITIEELMASLEAGGSTKNAPARVAAKATSSTASSSNKLAFSKSFSKYKYGRRVGAGLYAKGSAFIDGDGIHTHTNALVKVKVLKKKHYKMLDVSFNADVDPGSFEDTGYDFVIKSLGYNLYTKSKSLSEVSGMSTPEVDERVSKKVKKSARFAKAKKMVSSGSASTLIGYKHERDFGKIISKKQTIIAGFIPVVVEVGARATIGYVADVHLEGITVLEASFTPNARVGSWIDGGVGAGFNFFGLDVDYSAGVGGSFWLLSDDFKNSVRASLDLVENDSKEYIKYLEGNLRESIRNYYYGPHGRLYLYGKWYGPKNRDQFYKVWTWSGHKRTKTLVRWETTKKTTTLLNKHQNLFRITLVPDLGIKYPDAEIPSAPAVHKNILFAHGLKSSKNTWNTYTPYAEDKGWNVYRTNVDEFGSIATRAEQLATYINTLGLADNSLVAVGHSMGGLDLRYIVSHAHKSGDEPFVSAAKTITKIYTIATPHGGNQFGGIVNDGNKPALDDLGLSQMATFNKDYPYTTLEIDGRVVPFLALRSLCDNPTAFGTDGVVSIARQSLDGASYNFIPFVNKHNESATILCSDSIVVETENTEILDKILNNGIATNNYTEFITSHRDIVFYEHNSCEGDVIAKFNSNYTVDIDCSQSDECIANEASSMMLYPNVRKSTAIRIYDHPDKKTSTRNYMTIYRGVQDWTKPVCISGFEHSTSTKESGYGITTHYHKVDSSKGLNSEVSHIRVWNTKD